MAGRKLFSFLDVTDETPIQKLSIADQLRVFVRKIAKADREQLKVVDAETAYALTLRANLLEFLHKATEKVRQGEFNKVTVRISSKFNPVLDEVLQSSSIAPYYEVSVWSPDIEYDIDYFNEVTLEVKTY